jgi:hypothetical protein
MFKFLANFGLVFVEFQLLYVWFSAFSYSCFFISLSLYCVLQVVPA